MHLGSNANTARRQTLSCCVIDAHDSIEHLLDVSAVVVTVVLTATLFFFFFWFGLKKHRSRLHYSQQC